jgi:DNA-binding transcriptional MerR regulator
MKRGGGRRYYRPEDVEIIDAIRRLLHDDGYTIKGAQKLLREHGVRAVVQQIYVVQTSDDRSSAVPEASNEGVPDGGTSLKTIRDQLAQTRKNLENALKE